MTSKRSYSEYSEDASVSDLEDQEQSRVSKRRRFPDENNDLPEVPEDLYNDEPLADAVLDQDNLAWGLDVLNNQDLSDVEDADLARLHEIENALVDKRTDPADHHWKALLKNKVPINAFLEDPFRSKKSTLKAWISSIDVPEEYQEVILEKASGYWDSERLKLSKHVAKALWSETSAARRQHLSENYIDYFKSEDGKAFVLAVGTTYCARRVKGVIIPSINLRVSIKERLVQARNCTTMVEARKSMSHVLRVHQVLEVHNVAAQAQIPAKKGGNARANPPPANQQRNVALPRLVEPRQLDRQNDRAPAPARLPNAAPPKEAPTRVLNVAQGARPTVPPPSANSAAEAVTTLAATSRATTRRGVEKPLSVAPQAALATRSATSQQANKQTSIVLPQVPLVQPRVTTQRGVEKPSTVAPQADHAARCSTSQQVDKQASTQLPRVPQVQPRATTTQRDGEKPSPATKKSRATQPSTEQPRAPPQNSAGVARQTRSASNATMGKQDDVFSTSATNNNNNTNASRYNLRSARDVDMNDEDESTQQYSDEF